MIIAFPPCTFLSNAGARHLWKGHVLNLDRYAKGLLAKDFFMRIYQVDCPMIAIENPTPSRIYMLPEISQTIQPWMFGHPFTKRTNLWLKGLPPLVPTDVVTPERTWCPSGSYSRNHGEQHRGMFTTDRARNRSKTFPGIAKAMATQWGVFAMVDYDYCPCVDGRCPYWSLIHNDLFRCDEDCPFWSNEF